MFSFLSRHQVAMLIFMLISPLFIVVKSQQYQCSDEGVLYYKETQITQEPGREHQWLLRETNITGKLHGHFRFDLYLIMLLDIGFVVSKLCTGLGNIAVLDEDSCTLICVSSDKLTTKKQTCGKRKKWINGHCRHVYTAILAEGVGEDRQNRFFEPKKSDAICPDAGVLYHKETEECYKQLTQGPCLEHQWMVKEANDTGKLVMHCTSL